MGLTISAADTSVLLAAMDKLIGGMSTAFLTSIAGVTASLTFHILHVLNLAARLVDPGVPVVRPHGGFAAGSAAAIVTETIGTVVVCAVGILLARRLYRRARWARTSPSTRPLQYEISRRKGRAFRPFRSSGLSLIRDLS